MTARVQNPNQFGRRNTNACIDTRYWLTEKGIAATDAIRAAHLEAEPDEQDA